MSWYILKDKKPELYIPNGLFEKDKPEWIKRMGIVDKFMGSKESIVQQDRVNGFLLSTVFLTLNHGDSDELPILFETMIFDETTPPRKMHNDQWRYTSWDEAMKSHLKILKFLTALPHPALDFWDELRRVMKNGDSEGQHEADQKEKG